MSSGSDSDEFYDAEDGIANKSRKSKSGTSVTTSGQSYFTSTNDDDFKEARESSKVHAPASFTNASSSNDSLALERLQASRNRLKELRHRMQTEDEDPLTIAGNSPTGSQTSSLDGVFPELDSRSSHPFRIIEHDALSLHSLTSLGRIGRTLSSNQEIGVPPNSRESTVSNSLSGSTGTLSKPVNSVDDGGGGGNGPGGGSAINNQAKGTESILNPLDSSHQPVSAKCPPNSCSSEISKRCSDSMVETSVSLVEPDVIASTKVASTCIQMQPMLSGCDNSQPPIAPPRRKRKNKANPPNSLPLNKDHSPKLIKSVSADETPPNYLRNTLPSPSTTIESLTRELEHSLDISSAVNGIYLVKPQDGNELKSGSLVSSSETVSRANTKGPRNSSTYPLGGGVGGAASVMSGISSYRIERERRKSAGDEKSLLCQATSGTGRGNTASSITPSHPAAGILSSNSAGSYLQSSSSAINMFVRTRTDSGKPLSDLEILEQVTVLNLDTGERVPLSIAEDKLPQCINPLSLHIMRLTSEYVSTTSLEKEKESDEESVDSKVSSATTEPGPIRRKTLQFKKFLGTTVKRTMIKAKTIGRQGKEDGLEVLNENSSQQNSQGTAGFNQAEQYIKVKASNSHKGPYEFDSLQLVQDLSGEHLGPVWCMKFSSCGRLLATAGQDRILRVWVVTTAYPYFQEMRSKYNSEKVSPTPSQESLVSPLSEHDGVDSGPSPNLAPGSANPPSDGAVPLADAADEQIPMKTPFMPKPFCTYNGHTSDLLDISWSKNYFLLSSSMDKTVRLWHILRRECLCCFQHIEFVTAIVFHPRDDRYFLSGSLDGKLRLWNIPDKKVAVWNEVDGKPKLITAANFCQNGKFAVVGSYDGRCIFYNTDQLKYYTQIHVRSTRGKNSTGRKISGIEPMPGEDKILVTSNDSRIRLYDLRDLSVSCKYKGYVNMSSQIRASFSHDGKFIVSGSENQCIYIWKSNHDYSKFTSVRRDRNDYWEGIKVHNAVVTCAVFSPNPDVIMRHVEDQDVSGYVLVSADFNGCIKVFINKTKPKHSSLPASAMA